MWCVPKLRVDQSKLTSALVRFLLGLQSSLLVSAHLPEQLRVLVVKLGHRIPQPQLLRQIVEPGEGDWIKDKWKNNVEVTRCWSGTADWKIFPWFIALSAGVSASSPKVQGLRCEKYHRNHKAEAAGVNCDWRGEINENPMNLRKKQRNWKSVTFEVNV